MSIIIIGIIYKLGVGDADFTKMEILDGDDGLSNDKGIWAKRDIV